MLSLIRVYQHWVVSSIQQDLQRSSDDFRVLRQERLLHGGLVEMVQCDVVGGTPGRVFWKVVLVTKVAARGGWVLARAGEGASGGEETL